MTEFLYFEPKAIPEALSIMQEYADEIMPIAGGTDLILDVNHKRMSKKHLLSLTSIEDLSYIKDSKSILLGPTTILSEVCQSSLIADHCEMLVEAASVIGSVQIRNLASIGGNICNALPCADTVPPLVASDAQVVIEREGQQRTLSIMDFITSPRRTELNPDELLIKIAFPKKPLATGSVYLKHTYRKALDMTIVSIAISVTLNPTGERIINSGIALGNAGPVPIRATEAEELITGVSVDDGSVMDEFASAVMNSSYVRDSAVRASAKYRKRIIGVLAKRGLKMATDRAMSKIEDQRTS
jgi:carbon-monoxide dehydrogenase medium subunit